MTNYTTKQRQLVDFQYNNVVYFETLVLMAIHRLLLFLQRHFKT